MLLIILFAAFSSIGGLSQNAHLKIERLSDDLGLSQGLVYDMLQDSLGFIWVATPSGLDRFDGYAFQHFRPSRSGLDGAERGVIRAIEKAANGKLITAGNGGLQYFDTRTCTFSELLPMPNTELVDLKIDPDSNLWFVSETGYVYVKYHDAAEAEIVEEIPVGSTIESRSREIEIDGQGRIWINCTSGMAVIPFDEYPKLKTVHWLIPPVNVGMSPLTTSQILPEESLYFQGLAKSNDDRVWITQSHAIHAIDGETIQTYHIEDQTSMVRLRSHTYVDTHERLWLGSGVESANAVVIPESGKILFAPLDTDQPSIPPIESGMLSFLEDQAGVMWIGTNGLGIYKIDPNAQLFDSPPHAVKIPTFGTYPLAVDEGNNIWFARLRRPWLYYYNSKVDSVQHVNFPEEFLNLPEISKEKGFYINFIKTEGDSILWAGTQFGLLRLTYRQAQLTFSRWYPLHKMTSYEHMKVHGVFALTQDMEGNYWITTASTFGRFNPETGEYFAHSFDDLMIQKEFGGHVYPTVQGDPNTFWIGTLSGLIKYDLATEEFTSYTAQEDSPNHLSSNVIKSMCLDPVHPEKYLWIGTASNGLDRFDCETGLCDHFDDKSGLPDHTIYGVVPDSGQNIWISTNKGICRFNVETFTTRNFMARDGLQSAEFNTRSYAQSANGSIAFGGLEGINLFNPEKLFISPFEPKTFITEIQLDNKLYRYSPEEKILDAPISSASRVTLDYYQKVVSFQLSGLEPGAADQLEYRYWLEGFDKEWQNIGQERSFTFTNLDPGTYELKVNCTNRSGIWSDNIQSIDLIILPPWWRTWWAYSLYVVIAALAVYSIYSFQLRRQVEKSEAENLRQLDLAKSQLYTNITHEFRTPLTVILGMAETIENQDQPKKLIERNASQLLFMINQMLDLSKAESHHLEKEVVFADVIPVIQSICESFEVLSQQRKINFNTQFGVSEVLMDFDPNKINQILNNLLSNAFKFTPEGGKIEVSVVSKDEELHIAVTDTGIGMSTEESAHVFDRFYQSSHKSGLKNEGTGIGLAFTKELVELFEGSIQVDSEPGKGTRFIVILPITAEGESATTLISEPTIHIPYQQVEKSPTQSMVSKNQDMSENDGLPVLLLIEDNLDIATYIGGLVKDTYQFFHEVNGLAGRDRAFEIIPDVIISDVMMPEMDGYEVCEALKTDQRTSHIPIILLTAKSTTEARLTGLRSGADVYLNKPFNREELFIQLENLVKTRALLKEKYAGYAVAKEKFRETQHTLEAQFLDDLIDHIKRRIPEGEIQIPDLESDMKMSKMQFYRKLKALTGSSPTLFIRDVKLQVAYDLLTTSNLSVSEVAYEAGFTDPSYFTRAFKAKFGSAPTSLRS
ncbi:MAG: helix-turn-helix domain-containing protein [Flavobacteriales bacterium]|nr:helix-turn-helix domain-containing protein [Flavobacteriales bacterium]